MKKLKKDTIVDELLFLITQKSLIEKKGNINDFYFPLSELSSHLQKKYHIEYHSELHIYNQLKKFEKISSMDFFRKKTINDTIYINIKRFHQFKQLTFLNKSIKLLLANGACDLLNDLQTHTKFLSIYLGDGSECYYIAKLIFQQITSPINIYTNNLGIIHLYCDSPALEHIRIHTRTGQIHKHTFSILESPDSDFFSSINFDMIFQSPRYIKECNTYEVYPEVAHYNNFILSHTTGTKVIPLTLFEFFLPEEEVFPYGTILNFDYMILPTKKTNPKVYEDFIEKLPITMYKSYFSYNIYKVNTP